MGAVVAIAASVFLGHLAVLALVPGQPARALVSDLLNTLEDAAATAVLVFVGFTGKREKRRLSAGWLLLAVALACTAARDAGWWIDEVLLREPPFPSVMDFANLLYYPLFLASAFLLTPLRQMIRERIGRLLDMGIVVIAAALVFLVFLRSSIAPPTSDDSVVMTALSLLYPMGDFFLLAAMAVFTYGFRSRAEMPVMWLLVASAGARFSTDIVFGVQSSAGAYSSGSLFEIGWTLSAVFLALAAVTWRDAQESPRLAGGLSSHEETERRLGPIWLSHLPFIWIGGAFALLLWGQFRPLGANWPIVAVLTGVVVALAAVRQVLTLVENWHMAWELRVSRDALEARVKERTAELAAANQELSLLDRVREALSAELDMSRVLRAVVEEVALTLGYSHVSLYLVEDGRLVLQHQVGYTRVISQIPLDRGVSGKVARTGRAVLVSDSRTETDFLMALEGTRSAVSVPLVDRGVVAGVLSVEEAEDRQLGEDDLRLINAVSMQAGIAIGRAGLYRQARESEEALRQERAELERRVVLRAQQLAQTSEELRVETAERMRQEEHLRLLSKAVECASESLTILDARGVLLYVNPAFQKLVGLPREKIEGESIAALFSGRVDFSQDMREAIQGDRPWAGTAQVTTHAEERIILEVAINPLVDDRGQCAHWVGVLNDVTERVRLEERMRQGEKMEAVGRLAGGIAHDFNNLLTVITGYARLMLEDRSLPPDAQKQLAALDKAAQSATALTGELLAFSRKQVRAVRLLDLNVVVEAMAAMVARLVGEHVRVEIRRGEELWPVLADRVQIEQVILNLAANGADAMPGGGSLSISIENTVVASVLPSAPEPVPAGRYVRLQVHDTGKGIAPETFAHVFEPFFTTKERGKGTGLGLATVYGIVKQSEGHVCIDTAQGAGTTFSVYLPALQGSPDRVETPPGERIPRGSETVLVVDDQEDVRRLAMLMLSRLGYKAREAASGAEALALLSDPVRRVDLVLTDVSMPEMTGTTLGEHVANTAWRPRVIYMSGFAQEAIDQDMRGASFIQKPFTQRALGMAVRQALDEGC